MRVRVCRYAVVVLCIVVVACLGLFPAHSVRAAGIVVTTLNDNTNPDTLCSLREAITNANANAQAFTDCAAGSNATADPITFNVSGTILLGSSLPEITDHAGLTIDGSGHSVTISGQNAGSAQIIDILDTTVSLTLRALTIAHANAPNAAGVLNWGTLALDHLTFSENHAQYGGTVENLFGTVTVINSTFSGNAANNGSGAISHHKYSPGNPNTTIANSILANSTNGQDCRSLTGGFHSGGHNLVETPGSCTFTAAGDVTGQDPTLGSLASNGGATQTVALLPGSRAIDAGDDAICTATGSGAVGNTDQRGTARTDLGLHCDIGAFESQGFTLTLVGGSTPQSTPNTTAFPNPLAVTVTSSYGEPVNGGQVTFTPNPGGSSQTATLTTSPATIAGGSASVTAQANGMLGSYTVTASAAGAPSATFTLTNVPGPATTLTPSPTTPQSAVAGTAFPSLSITAKDAGGNLVADGTAVTFTVTPAGNGASATFSNAGSATTTSGVATITATANTIAGGPYTVTATSNGHTATFTLTNTPGQATTPTVAGYPASVVSGTTHTFTVTARDQFNTVATGYTGTVHLTSSDSQATLPTDYTFVAADAGTYSFTATLGAAGTWNLTATDTTTSTLTVGTHHLTATYTPATPGPYTASQGTGDATITAAALVSITMTPASATLKGGQTQQYSATGTYADNSTADLTSQVTWSSDATSIASVDATGTVMGKSAGSAHVTATLGGMTGQTGVTVSEPLPVGIAPGIAPSGRPSATGAPPPTPPTLPAGGVPAPAPTGR